MKKALSLILVLVLCLSMCACSSEDNSLETLNTTGNTIITENETTLNTNTDVATPIVYDHKLKHSLVDTLLGEWLIDDALSGFVMPVKIVFKDNGTCVVEYPEESKEDGYDRPTNYNWGIVPDCIGNDTALYVRIGTKGELWYLFQLTDTGRAAIATHSIDPDEGGFLIDGFTEDGYKGMWFHMKKEV